MDQYSDKSRLKKHFFVKFALITIGIGSYAAFKFSFFTSKPEEIADTKWNRNFKDEFIKSCYQKAKSGVVTGLNLDIKYLKPEQEKIVHTYSNEYCKCLTGKIESKEIVMYEYKSLRAVASNELRLFKVIGQYMNSPEGNKDINYCVEFANSKIN